MFIQKSIKFQVPCLITIIKGPITISIIDSTPADKIILQIDHYTTKGTNVSQIIQKSIFIFYLATTQQKLLFLQNPPLVYTIKFKGGNRVNNRIKYPSVMTILTVTVIVFCGSKAQSKLLYHTPLSNYSCFFF